MPHHRVLIVEDEPNIVESLRFILEQASFAVEVVTDGTKALDHVLKGNYSVVVLDVMLPGRSGLDILRAMRSDSSLRDTPVIVLTAKGQARDREAAEELGANLFITKPFSNAEVVECVRNLAG